MIANAKSIPAKLSFVVQATARVFLPKKSSDSEAPDRDDSLSPAARAMFGVPKKALVLEDDTLVFDFLILGGGAAAFHTAEEFARQGKKYSVAVISREAFPPCYPKSMVQVMAANGDIFSSLLATEKWFEENNITLSLNTNVTFLDAKKRLLIADRTDPVTHQTTHLRICARGALVLATGARPQRGPPLLVLDGIQPPPSTNWNGSYPQVTGLFTLRTFSGGLAIHNYLPLCTRAVVVGGGFLGLDMAYIAHRRGVPTTLVTGSQLLGRVFTNEMSDHYRQFFQNEGVDVITENRCAGIQVREGRVVGVTLQDGSELSCDLVMVACGVIPNVELFREQLQLEKGTKTPGVLVDPFLLTSVPGVYAIGDVCAMRYSQHNPGAIRHLSHAQASGTHVAKMLVTALTAAENFNNKRRGSKISSPKPPLRTPRTVPERMMEALVPGSEAVPYIPHPAYDVNHFNFRGHVSGDRLGPDFVMVGCNMGPEDKLLTLWLWENRVVGAFVSNPSEEEKQLLDTATVEQWYMTNMPELRAMSNAFEALRMVDQFHRL